MADATTSEAGPDLSAYVNGELVPKSEATVPISDHGFKWGYAVFDSLRTYAGDPVFIESYLDRITRTARAMRIELPLDRDELRGAIERVVEENFPRLERDDDDLKMPLYISGVVEGKSGGTRNVVIVPSPIDFSESARAYLEGARLITANTRNVSPETLSPNVKSTARLHLRLADIEVHRQDPDAIPLMLDLDGNVSELTYANVFIVTDGRLVTPTLRNVLGGVTRSNVMRLTRGMDIEAEEADFRLYDVYNADEVFFTSSSKTLVPVSDVDGVTVGDGRPGPVTTRLLEAFGEEVGIDVVEQALSHLPSGERPNRLKIGG